MNKLKRWSFGFLSTCFLAVGLVRAADMLDPVNRELRATRSSPVASPTPDCIAACHVAEPTPDCIAACHIAEPTPDCIAACHIASDLN